jgi:hypothetical protein
VAAVSIYFARAQARGFSVVVARSYEERAICCMHAPSTQRLASAVHFNV